MKRLLIGLLIFILIIGAVLFSVPYLVPAETLRDRVAQQLANWTGREILLAGPARLSVFPNLAVEIDDVTIANPPDLDTRPLIAMRKLSGSVQLMPLLSGNIVVDQFLFVRPQINLIVGADGTRGWDFSNSPALQNKAGDNTETTPDGSPIRSISDITIGRMEVEQGVLVYADKRSGQEFSISEMNMRASWPALSQPLQLDGGFLWNAEHVSINTTIDKVFSLLDGHNSAVKLGVKSKHITGDISGQVNMAADLAVNGRLNIQSPSIRKLADWAGMSVGNTPGLGPLEIQAGFVAGGSKLSLADGRFRVDDNVGEGTITALLGGAQPYVQATLAFNQLNLNPYLGAGQKQSQRNQATTDGWSTDKIDLSGLSNINADLRISAQDIDLAPYDIGSGAISVTVKNGQLIAEIVNLKTYGGEINATVSANSAAQPPRFGTRAKITNVDLGSAVGGLTGNRRITGRGNANLDLAGRGNNQKQIMSSLAGSAALEARDGTITGVDLAQLVAAIQQKNIAKLVQIRGGESGFQKLSASYAIAGGKARGDDLDLVANAVRGGGAGTIDFGQRQLDYDVNLDVIRQGQIAAGQSEIIAKIPVSVRGPWDSPTITPDATALVIGSDTVQKTVQGVTDAVKTGDLKEVEKILKESPDKLIERGKNLFQGGESGDGVNKLLNNLLGGSN